MTQASPTPSSLEDQTHMSKYLQGDFSAFEWLYRKYRPKVKMFLGTKALSASDIEDLTQAIFFKFHRVRASYRSGTPVAPWIFSIARSQWIDFLRKKSQEPKYMTEFREENYAANIPVSENAPALESLSPEKRKILQMKYVEGKTFSEISQELQKPEPALRKTVSRLLQKLKKEASR